MRWMKADRFWKACLPALCLIAYPAPAAPSMPVLSAGGSGAKSWYAATEVNRLVADLRALAEEEIERTAAAAVKEAALEFAPRLAAAEAAAAGWEAEAGRLRRAQGQAGWTLAMAAAAAFVVGWAAGGAFNSWMEGRR